ncbi:hypothetical protein P3S68_017411 [Capsicum galapagoense]
MEEHPESIIKDPLHRDVEEGQLYWDKNTISSVMKHYAICERFQFKVKRSSSSRYYLKCINQRCNWIFRSSNQQNLEIFMVTKFVNDHICPIANRMLSQRHATSLTIAKMVKHNFLNLKSTYTLAEIMEEMRNLYGIRMNYKKVYRAKEKILELVRGSLRESYAKLPAYLYMVNIINPGSFTRLHKTEDNHFLYAFVALSTSIRGWRYCMPTIVIDGTFLKSAYKGTMLSASVLDAAEGMCIVSDRHGSILKVVALVYPNVAHYICIYHLWNNIKGRFKNNQKQLKEIFFTMARTYIKFMMDLIMRWNNEHKQKNLILSNKMKVMSSTHYSYVVIDETGKRNIVCMREKKSSCLQFQVDGIPCPHAMTVLTYTHMDLQSYCAPYYTRENFLKVYELSVIPLLDETTWHISAGISANIVLPPIWKSKSGRQKKTTEERALWTTLSNKFHVGTVEK